EYRAWVGGGEGAKLVAIHARHVAGDADFPKVIELALVDREVQREALRRWIILGLCRRYADIGITLAAVVKPQLFLVLRYAVGIVDVSAGQKAQHMGGGSLDHGAELPFAEGLVAGEVDLPHRSFFSLRYGVDKVDPAIAAVDDLRIDADLGAAGTPVCLDDAADVGLHAGTLQRAT